jgi:DNA-binding LacI/PurR family transcriptional regulator
MLLDMLESERRSPRHVELSLELVARGSTAPPPAG